MERSVSKTHPWFTRIHFPFEKVKPDIVAAYCDGHVIVDSRRSGRTYVEPGFHAVEDDDDEYGNLYVALYEDGIGALPVFPVDESTPEEWAQAQNLFAGKTQRVQFQEELEDAEDRAELEAEARLTGVRYHL